jgi:hypothetical protein
VFLDQLRHDTPRSAVQCVAADLRITRPGGLEEVIRKPVRVRVPATCSAKDTAHWPITISGRTAKVTRGTRPLASWSHDAMHAENQRQVKRDTLASQIAAPARRGLLARTAQ